MSSAPTFETLTEAKQFLRDNWEKGTNCPCCGQIVKLYKYKLDASKALAVIGAYKLAKLHNGESFHLTNEFASVLKLNANGLHYTKMKYYGFIEQDNSQENPEKKGSGYWFITQKGIDFVKGRIEVPSTFFVYNNILVGFGPDKIKIKEALDEKFDYRELMEGYYNPKTGSFIDD